MSVLDPQQAAAAFMLGLAGAGHCLGMCGGIASALSLGGRGTGGLTIAYQGGRVLSYTVLGAVLGLAASSVDLWAWTIGLRYLAGALMVAMGLYIADWWRGLARLEQAGAALWRPVQKLTSSLIPVTRWQQALGLGLCWGLMPCGLIYSSLALAATTQNAVGAATMMMLFGLGTLPAMLATSLGAQQAQQFLRKKGLKLAIALMLIASGLWTIYLTAAHSGHTAHSNHSTHPTDARHPTEHNPLHHQAYP